MRIFVILDSYYSYEQKVGGVSLIAGFSIGNGLRVSFDFGSFFFKNNKIITKETEYITIKLYEVAKLIFKLLNEEKISIVIL